MTEVSDSRHIVKSQPHHRWKDCPLLNTTPAALVWHDRHQPHHGVVPTDQTSWQWSSTFCWRSYLAKIWWWKQLHTVYSRIYRTGVLSLVSVSLAYRCNIPDMGNLSTIIQIQTPNGTPGYTKDLPHEPNYTLREQYFYMQARYSTLQPATSSTK